MTIKTIKGKDWQVLALTKKGTFENPAAWADEKSAIDHVKHVMKKNPKALKRLYDAVFVAKLNEIIDTRRR